MKRILYFLSIAFLFSLAACQTQSDIAPLSSNGTQISGARAGAGDPVGSVSGLMSLRSTTLSVGSDAFLVDAIVTGAFGRLVVKLTDPNGGLIGQKTVDQNGGTYRALFSVKKYKAGTRLTLQATTPTQSAHQTVTLPLTR